MRRVRVSNRVVGKRREIVRLERERLSLRYDAWRLELPDGRVSTIAFVKLAAHQLAAQFTEQGRTMKAVYAYNEIIIEETLDTDPPLANVSYDWPEGIVATHVLYFGRPKR